MEKLITHLPLYTVADISRATGVDAMTIRNWFQRKILLPEANDKPSEGQGKARLFSATTALAVGVVKLVVDAGIRPTIAAQAGIQFAHVGGRDVETRHYRNPSDCFHEHKGDPILTYLVLPTYRQDLPWVLAVEAGKTDIEVFMRRIRSRVSGPTDNALIIRLDQTVGGIKRSLLGTGKQEQWRYRNPDEYAEIREIEARPMPKASGWVGEDN